MDSDESDNFQRATAFHIERAREDDIDFSVPPANGVEYLQRVMLESKKCDKVVSVNLHSLHHSKSQTNFQEETKETSPLAPSQQWQESQVSNFSKVRQRVGVLKMRKCPLPRIITPALDDSDGWRRLCFGSLPCKHQDNLENKGSPPLLSIVTSMGQPVVDQLLEWHSLWLQECSHMTDLHGQWLYALLACLELPLHPDTCSTIRGIARTCHNIRSIMVDPETSELAALNLIICLVGKYFHQNDLAD